MSGPHFDLTSAIRRNAYIIPTGIATITDDETVEWLEFERRVSVLAGSLRALGLQAGDRFALFGANSAAYLEWMYAGLWAGLALVPLNRWWTESELAFALNDCTAAALVVDPDFSERAEVLKNICPALRHVIRIGPPNQVGLFSRDLMENAQPAGPPALLPDALAGVFYTGGTTGFPKGVKLSHGNLWCGASMICAAVSLSPQSRYLHVAPMFHLADASMSFAVTMCGGSHAFIPAFDAAAVSRKVMEHGITHAVLVPTMISRILEDPSFAPADWASLQRLIYGAAPMPQVLVEKLSRRLPAVGLVQAYGQTELAPVATILSPEDHSSWRQRPEILRSAGRPVPGVELEVVTADLKRCASGEVGQIRVKGPNATDGYWGRERETRETVVDGWIMTGDLGRLDQFGYLYIVDRAKDMIISGGENVYSAEVENALSSHPGVLECAVIGAADADLGERVHGVVVLREGSSATAEELRMHCRSLIAGYKCPRSIELRGQPLPRSAAGKVLKRDLRETLPEESQLSQRVAT